MFSFLSDLQSWVRTPCLWLMLWMLAMTVIHVSTTHQKSSFIRKSRLQHQLETLSTVFVHQVTVWNSFQIQVGELGRWTSEFWRPYVSLCDVLDWHGHRLSPSEHLLNSIEKLSDHDDGPQQWHPVVSNYNRSHEPELSHRLLNQSQHTSSEVSASLILFHHFLHLSWYNGILFNFF